MSVSPPDADLPAQGWKIHISGVPTSCLSVLKTAAGICAEFNTPFKFLLDENLLRLSISKGWPREASGKFITIYPKDEDTFHLLLDKLANAVSGHSGPYILSDKRYKNIANLYYRYGGILAHTMTTIKGESIHIIVAPDGQPYADQRLPFWQLPPWVSDPYDAENSRTTELTLQGGRYLIKEALGFSVTGGVYKAYDHAHKQYVVIKEARPFTNVSSLGLDAIGRLQREYRLLNRLRGSGVAPEGIDFFTEWEHAFLVEEYIEGIHLGAFTISNNPLMRIRPTAIEYEQYREVLVHLWRQLLQALSIVHDSGVILGDVSLLNIMVPDGNRALTFVDLEGAWNESTDVPDDVMTPGFVSTTRGKGPWTAEDVYGAGVTMIGTLFPSVNILDLEVCKRFDLLEVYGSELRIPGSLRDVVRDCICESPAGRLSADEALQRIDVVSNAATEIRAFAHSPVLELGGMPEAIAEYVRNSGDPERNDRLFPADPRVFVTNPLGVAYGAAGVAYGLSRLDGDVPDWLRTWLLERAFSTAQLPPGLYVGGSGLAWVLGELGYWDVGEKVLSKATADERLFQLSDIFYGSAGYGLTCLKFYLATGAKHWLDHAIKAAENILQARSRTDDGATYWSDEEGYVWRGYARGTSGIALFLLYLSLVTDTVKYREVGASALAFEIANLARTSNNFYSVPRGPIDQDENVLTHYWLDGTAGVISTLIRYWALTKSEQYWELLSALIPDIDRKYTAFPGLFRGLAGLINSMLDVVKFTGDEKLLQSASRSAEGLCLFAMQRPSGLAFPGEQLFRISTDFSSGSIGVGLVVKRLLAHKDTLPDFNFTLDKETGLGE